MRARAAGEEPEAVAHAGELRAERIRNAGLEPADHPGAPAHEHDAALPRVAQHLVEAVQTPDREHVRGVAAANENHVVLEREPAQVVRRPRVEAELGRTEALVPVERPGGVVHVGGTDGRRLAPPGDPDEPLLVSVRSGAAVSMPGMMDSILNLGLNDAAVEGLARTTENSRFARDSYRRLIQMYGEVVDGIDGHRFEQALGDLKRKL